MKLVIDGRPLVGQRTGIGVHTAEIARRLTLDTPPLIASHAPIDDREGLERCDFRVDPARFGVVWQQVTLPRIDGDVLWGPHGTLPIASRKAAIATIHDLSSITMPEKHRLKTIVSFNLFIGRSLEIAERVACVSTTVADETMRSFGVPASKIAIVPNGVDEYFSPGGVEEDYILFTGTLEPRKGLDDLLAAWRSLPAPRPRLVLCGGAGWRTTIAEEVGVETTGYVTRERLRDLYRHALAFVYPSRYEGFGIPPLEAMACGAPVIATRTGAVEEFAGDAALLVKPGDQEGLRGALRQLLGDAALRQELRVSGPIAAASWGWERAASRMSELIREVAG